MKQKKQKLQIKYIRLDKLNLPSPSLRFGINQKKFEELKKSIQVGGIKYPIVVRKLGRGEYAVVAGEQRVKACNQLGFSPSYLVPCIEVDVDDPQAIEYGLIENVVRQELTPFEEANALHLLVERYGYKQRELAQRLGKTEGYISQLLSIFALPKYILNTIRKGEITLSHGIVLLRFNKKAELQKKLFTRIIKDKLSREDTVMLASLLERRKTFPSFYKPQVWELKDGSRVRIEPRKTGLRIELYYSQRGDIDSLLRTVKARIKGIQSRREN